MPFLDVPSHRVHYDVAGTTGPWLTFCNSLGTDLHMWDAQATALSRGFRVLRYDRRGHGLSGSPAGDYSLGDLSADVVALLDALSIECTHFVGLSLGGLVGQYLAMHAPRRLDRVVVCATAMKVGTREGWHARKADVLRGGLGPLVEATATRWFTPGFRQRHPGEVDGILATFARVDPVGYAGCCAALAEADMTPVLRSAMPLLAISGDDDPVCRTDELQAIADRTGGRHVSLPGRHLVNVEAQAAFNDNVRQFLTSP